MARKPKTKRKSSRGSKRIEHIDLSPIYMRAVAMLMIAYQQNREPEEVRARLAQHDQSFDNDVIKEICALCAPHPQASSGVDPHDLPVAS
jgi:hypothetical protein